MSAAEHRQQLITKLAERLSRDGWSEEDFANLPAELQQVIEWTPDKQFKNPQDKFALLEVEDELAIPSWLVRTSNTYKDQLRGTEIIVACVQDTPVSVETARIAAKNSIHLYAGHSNPVSVFNPSVPCFSKASQEIVRPAKNRFEICKRIPKTLTESLKNLDNLTYSSELRRFAELYENRDFGDWDEEHKFVRDFLIEDFAHSFDADQLFEGLDVLSLLDEVSEAVGKRPNFLHSFQTFLLGSIIIDNNHDLLNRLYHRCFNPQINTKLDVPWFFASLFHDVASPFENIDRLGPIGRMLEYEVKGIYSTYVPHLLGAWFNQANTGPVDPKWKPQLAVSGEPLCGLLTQNRTDHGVLEAMSLISSATNASNETLATVVTPAAFAVAIHNSRLWPSIVEKCPFPLDAKKFLLAFLLLVCDNIEECGRERMMDLSGQKSPKALILEANMTQNLGMFDIWFDEPAAAILLRNRFDWINSKLFAVNDLKISCSLRID